MKKAVGRSLVLGILLLLILIEPVSAQQPITFKNLRKVAITIDDLPLNGPNVDIKRLRALNENLIRAISDNKIPAVGFVNESLLYVPGEVDQRISILKLWGDARI